MDDRGGDPATDDILFGMTEEHMSELEVSSITKTQRYKLHNIVCRVFIGYAC